MILAGVLYRVAQTINVLALLCLSGLLCVWPQQRVFLSQSSLEKLIEVNFVSVVIVLSILISCNAGWLFYYRFYVTSSSSRWVHFIISFITGGFSSSLVLNWYLFMTSKVEKFSDIELIKNKTWSLLLEPDYNQKIQNLNDWYSSMQPDFTLLPKWSQAPFQNLITQAQHRDYVISYIEEQGLLRLASTTPVLTWWGWCKENPVVVGAATAAALVLLFGISVWLCTPPQRSPAEAAEEAAEEAAKKAAEKAAERIIKSTEDLHVFTINQIRRTAAFTQVKMQEATVASVDAIAGASLGIPSGTMTTNNGMVLHTPQNFSHNLLWWLRSRKPSGLLEMIAERTPQTIAKTLSNKEGKQQWAAISEERFLRAAISKITELPDQLNWAYCRMCCLFNQYVHGHPVNFPIGFATPQLDSSPAKEVVVRNIQQVEKWCTAVDVLPFDDKSNHTTPGVYWVIKACKDYLVSAFGL